MSTEHVATQAELQTILSESRLDASAQLDTLPVSKILRIINQADQGVASAVAGQIPVITRCVEAVVARLKNGGRLIYCGAGTSGRMGIIDAVECRPTFSVSDELVQGCIAGGENAFIKAVEGAEDDPLLAHRDLSKLELTAQDCVIALAASGRTPYAVGALEYAQSVGAYSASIICNPTGVMNTIVKDAIVVAVGPEVLTGSTRMKAGTAQKLVLNMLSTTVMVKLGKVYSNLMVDVNTTNAKLKGRARSIVMQATGCTEADAQRALIHANGSAKLAILMYQRQLSLAAAEALLNEHHGFLRQALEAATNG